MNAFLSTTLLLPALVGVLATALPAARAADTPPVIRLWPKDAPGDTSAIRVEHDSSPADGGPVAGKRVIRLADVSVPTITVYRPTKARDTGAAVLVCPGGGYNILAYDLEGTEVCEWLNSLGVTGVLLKYRVPSRAGIERHIPALQDAQRAMGIVRSRAASWGIHPDRIGVLGFSAGGHLSALLSTSSDTRAYPVVDIDDAVSCRPDFVVLIYPAYLYEGGHIAPGLHVSATTPPTFLAQSEDDPIHVENALYYYIALKNAGVAAELHVFPTGGHGYGMRAGAPIATAWPALAQEWMRHRGLLSGSALAAPTGKAHP